MAPKVNCSICGKSADSSLDNCPHCGSPIEAGRVAPPPPIASGSSDDQCPSCGAAVQDGDIVCVRCGVNLLTGHQVAQKKPEYVAPPPSKAPYIVGALVVIVVLLVGGLVYVLMQDPIKGARQKARAGDTPGAINQLLKYTDSHQNDGDAFAMLGRLYWQSKQYVEASSCFDTASRLNPEEEDLAFMAVLAAGKLPGDTGTSRQLDALKRMTKDHPDNAQARKMLALAQGAAGEFRSSDGNLTAWAALANAPEEVATYRAIIQAMDGDYAAASASLISAGSGNSAASLAKGYLASLEGEPAKAVAVLADAVDSANGATSEVATTRLGLLYMAEGDFDKALPLLRPAQGRAASDSGRFFYGLCLQTAGLGDDALTEFDRLVSGGGEFAEDAAIQMAIAYSDRDQFDRAEESIRKARQFGTSARLYTVEGQILALQGDFTGAQGLYRKAILEDPDYPAVHLEHGLVYVRMGALNEGVRELERYLELADDGVAGARVNEIDLLVKQLQQALDRAKS